MNNRLCKYIRRTLIITVLLLVQSQLAGQSMRERLIMCSDMAKQETLDIWKVSREKANHMTISRHYAIRSLPIHHTLFSADTVAIIEYDQVLKVGKPTRTYYFYSNKSDIAKCYIDAWIPFKLSDKKFRLVQEYNMRVITPKKQEIQLLYPIFHYYTTDGINDGNYAMNCSQQIFLDSYYYYSIMVFIRQEDNYRLVLYRIIGQTLEKEKSPTILVLPPY